MSNAISKIISRAIGIRKKARLRRIYAHKDFLRQEANRFKEFSNVLFVIQSHNSEDTIRSVVKQFTDASIQNILVYADGCSDNTANNAKALLSGKNHYLISCNDIYEIRNYRLSLDIASFLGCEYALLLQDDDLYSSSFKWLDSALERFYSDPSLAIIGFRDGLNLTPVPPSHGDESFATATWWSDFNSNPPKCGLDSFYEYAFSRAIPTENGEDSCYVAIVNRAPQLVCVEKFKKLNLFPEFLEPYQYDDEYNCFQCWLSGYKVLHMPLSIRRPAHEGGMRLYNTVKTNKRPDFHRLNYNRLLEEFQGAWSNGDLQGKVNRANENIHGHNS